MSLVTIYNDQGQCEIAEQLGREVLDVRNRLLGIEHSDTLCSMNSLVLIYERQRRLGEAEEVQRRIFEINKKVLGAEHRDML